MADKTHGDDENAGSRSHASVPGHSPPTKLPAKKPSTDFELTDLSILDSLHGSVISDSSLDLQIRFQRLLAESALETSTNFDTSLRTSLHDPHEEPVSEHSHSISSHSFSHSELNDSQFESFSRLLAKEGLGAAFDKLASGDFIPGELALQKIEADEKQWYKENVAASERAETSNFSGILGDSEISLSSSVAPGIKSKKVSADEFFKLKTDAIGTLQPSKVPEERPNFGSVIVSPAVGRTRGPLIEACLDGASESGDRSGVRQESTSDSVTEVSVTESDISCKSSDEPVGSSTLSTSGIQKIISEYLQDSTRLLTEKLVHGSSGVKSTLSSSQHCSAEASVLSQTVDEDEIEIEHLQEVEAVLGSKTGVSIKITNPSAKWLRCHLTLEKVVCLEKQNSEEQDLVIVHMPDAAVIAPNEVAPQLVDVTPQIAGHFLIHVNINLEDAVTKNMLTKQSFFEVICKVPKFEVKVDGLTVSELDFGFIPTNCVERIHAQLLYASVPVGALCVRLAIEEVCSSDRKFFLTRGKMLDAETLSLAYTNYGAKLMHFTVVFKAPDFKDGSRSQIQSFSAYLNISGEGGGKPFLFKKIKLHARTGFSQLVLDFPTPVVLHSSGVGVSVSKSLTLKNDGVIPLRVEVSAVSDNRTSVDSHGVLLVNNGNMVIKPGQEGIFNVSFMPSFIAENLKRKVTVQILPGGEKFVFEVHGIMKQVNLQDSGSSSDSDSSAKSSKLSGPLPISTTHKQLVWNTVPVGKSETLSCRLRNDGPNPARVQISLVDSSHSYRLLSEHGEIVSVRKFKLHSKECMTFRVTFLPAHPGVACGKITVSEPKRGGDSAERFAIPLYGFGGNFSLIIRDIPKDANGCMWLNLGPIDSTMHSQFSLHNKGNLEAFVYIKYTPKGVGSLLEKTNVKISSSQMIIPPGASETVYISLTIDRDDVKFVTEDSKEQLQIGVLNVICGDEPTRHRIRRIAERGLAKSGKNLGIDLDGLCRTFPGEKNVTGVNLLDDPESRLRVLYRTFQLHELPVSVEKFGDRSLAMQTYAGSSTLVNSSIFKSMFEDNSGCSDTFENSSLWSVTPSVLNLLVPCFGSGCFTIGSNHKDDQAFEVACSVDFLSVEPQCGLVPSMGEAIVIVTCSVNAFKTKPSPRALLQVYLENDVKTVTVITKKMEEATVGQVAALRGQQMMVSQEEFLSSHNQLSTVKKISAQAVTSGRTVLSPLRFEEPLPASAWILPLNYEIIFPITPVGTVSHVSFKVENAEPRPLRVQVHISLPFTVEKKMFSLKEMGTAILKLSFYPSSVGKYQQSMVLSVADRQPQTYSVNGEAV